MTPAFSVNLGPDQDELERQAARLNLPVGQLIREAVAMFLRASSPVLIAYTMKSAEYATKLLQLRATQADFDNLVRDVSQQRTSLDEINLRRATADADIARLTDQARRLRSEIAALQEHLRATRDSVNVEFWSNENVKRRTEEERTALGAALVNTVEAHEATRRAASTKGDRRKGMSSTPNPPTNDQGDIA